jgi:hypothetical protein
MAIGFPVKDDYVSGDVLTAANMNDLSGTLNTLSGVGSIVNKNYLINGGLDVWQRGTSLAISNGTTTYLADRWAAYRGATGATVSRQTTSDTTNLPTIQYCARVQRDSGNTSTSGISYFNIFESVNSIPFAGQTVTFSFYARKGANYSQASSGLTVVLKTGTGTDQNVYSGFTGAVNPVLQTATLTTTWQRFTYTATLASSITQIATGFEFAPVGTAGAADYFEVTGAQLELGSVATTFSRAQGTIQGELAACQRYYWRSVTGNVYARHPGSGAFASATTGYFALNNPVQLRISAPSVDFSNLTTYDFGTNRAVTNVTLATDQQTPNCTSLTINIASGGTQYRPFQLTNDNNANGYIGISAEL